MSLRYLSVCSGIEAATQAWHPLGWQPAAFSEIEKFPSAVLAHHYPHVPNLGDMTKFQEWPDLAIDLLCGGTPCQSFSVAGLRQGLADPRGNLMLTFGAIAGRYRPRWLVWENVPGVLSSNGGRDFGAFLGMLGQLGYGFAYRVLDAQHVRTRRFPLAVPQRRRRVFVVAYLGDWRRAAAVLFDRESLSGHPAPRRETGKGIACGFECGPQGGSITDVAPTLDTRCKDGPIRNQLGAGVMCADVAPTLNAHFGDKQGLEDQHINGGGACSLPPAAMCLTGKMTRLAAESETLLAVTGGGFDVAHALRGEGFDASEDGTGRGTQLMPIAFGHQNAAAQGDSVAYGFSPTLDKSKTPAVAFDLAQITSAANRTRVSADLPASTLNAAGQMHVAQAETLIDTLKLDWYSGVKLLTGREIGDGKTEEARPGEVLRELCDAIGEEAFSEWKAGIHAALRATEVLRSEVHGGGVRRQAGEGGPVLDDGALPCQEAGSAGALLEVREVERDGRSPPGRGSHEQRSGKSGEALSELPHEGTSDGRDLHNLWSEGEGSRLLQQAFAALEKTWRPADHQNTATPELHRVWFASECERAVRAALHAGQAIRNAASNDRSDIASGKGGVGVWAVRRLTPRLRECERLQAFPDNFTRIQYRGKPADQCPDGPRYKAIGNSWAVNCAEWIGERIAEVDTWKDAT